jgi:hypothetical protein
MKQLIENKRQVARKSDGESGARLISLRAAARYLGVSYWTMRDLALGGTIPIVRIPYPGQGMGARSAGSSSTLGTWMRLLNRTRSPTMNIDRRRAGGPGSVPRGRRVRGHFGHNQPKIMATAPGHPLAHLLAFWHGLSLIRPRTPARVFFGT